jgi:SAM-dependent methyltransferase
MLKPSKNDIALEVGCGNGKFCFWNRQLFGTVVGVDAATLFAEEALEDIPLVRGDVRLLPFAPASFDKIFSIDLLEHLPASGIAPFFSEINRVLKPGGLVFIFSNTREKGKLWPVISFEKRVAGYFVQKGIFDFKRDELRKSDHIKAITTFEELEDAVKKGGFRLEQKVFWNGVFQGLVDNIIIKGGEYLMRRRVRRHLDARKKGHNTPASRLAAGTTGISSDWADGGKPRTKENEKPEKRTKVELEAEKVAEDARRNNEIDLAIRRSMKRQIGNKKSGGLYYILSAFTSLMKLDIRLFGKMRTGPYFILIRKTGSPVSK